MAFANRKFESCVNSRYSKTMEVPHCTLVEFESCVNSRYSKTRDKVAHFQAGLRAV